MGRGEGGILMSAEHISGICRWTSLCPWQVWEVSSGEVDKGQATRGGCYGQHSDVRGMLMFKACLCSRCAYIQCFSMQGSEVFDLSKAGWYHLRVSLVFDSRPAMQWRVQNVSEL
jgi:hypothetical protein